MPNLIIIRLHPRKPKSGDEFTADLVDLKIKLRDRSFGEPKGTGAIIGSAFYDPADTASTILQHDGPPLLPTATAIVEITAPPPNEYDGSDLALEVTRGGEAIVDRRLHYNVEIARDSNGNPLTVLPAQDPADYAATGPVGLYLALPSAGTNALDLPEDGTAPGFAELMAAVQQVTSVDPNTPPADLAALTRDQCRHIANEIIWNRTLDPMPPIPDGKALEELYAPGADEDMVRRRERFEADQTAYHAIHTTRADTLAKFIFSMSAALACAARTTAATQVGFRFPVLPGIAATGSRIPEAAVVFTK